MTGDVWKIEGRFKKKVKYYPFCARNLHKEVKRYMIKRPELPEQSIYNMADHRGKKNSRNPERAGGVVPDIPSFSKQIFNPKDVADIALGAMDATMNMIRSLNLGSKTQIT